MKLDIIYNEDCIGKNGIRILPDKSIDMVLCDMPYGTTACKWDTIIPFKPLWKQYKRIIKDRRAIVLTASQPFTTILIVSNMKMFKYCWVWDKVIGSNFVNAEKMPLKVTEDICIFYNRHPVYNPQMTRRDKKNERQSGKTIRKENSITEVNFIQTSTKGKKKYPINKITINRLSNELNSKYILHPTQKPVALFEYLIKTYTNEGDIVLDNCMGSGTTAIACKRLNRHYIGFEINKEYCEIAEQRLEAEKTLWD